VIRRAAHHAIDLRERPLDPLLARPARHSVHPKLHLFHYQPSAIGLPFARRRRIALAARCRLDMRAHRSTPSAGPTPGREAQANQPAHLNQVSMLGVQFGCLVLE